MKNIRNIIMIGIAGVLAVLAIGYALVVTPVLAQVSKGETDFSEAKDQLNQINATVSKLQGYKDKATDIEGIRTTLDQQFPNTAAVIELNGYITMAAAAAGLPASSISSIATSLPTIEVALPSATPSPAATETSAPTATSATPTAGAASKVASMKVTISAKGSKEELIAFAKNLNKMERSVLVLNTSMSFSGGTTVGAGANEGTLSVEVKAYLYKSIPLPKDNNSSNATPSPTSSPTSSSPTSSSPTSSGS